jgi:hypothetical protein
MRALKMALLGLAAAGLASSAQAALLYQNNFDGNETTGVGVTGFYSGLPTEGAAAGAWNADGWAGNYGASRATGDPAELTGLNLSGLAAHTTVTATFVLGFLESWDSYDGGCCSPDYLDILIDGVVVQTLTYNNALGTVKDTDGNPVLFEYVQANSNGYYSDTLVGYSLTFAHTGSTLDFQFQARGGGWQGGGDEGYGIDNSVFTYDGVRTPGVPEPATWATMIGGFGLAGATLRRRRSVLAS